ncbi:Fasciclin-2 precursor, putative [Pediculus humanus corporis]|uniref:Fasciclin-2, putative n=1 Tax=Pediculus humanus subsp. corporis TaxID=121224 RepID=E0VLC3_PEDHC|nr:Fasciclin-2 precursor, putative [Pediculus humanus corporis]EEB14179.1 Fasciclin-2 precursor, putative [Pediculus humanus corporis]
MKRKNSSSAKEPTLIISPNSPVQIKPVGGSALLTCQPDVENQNLVSDLSWKGPQNLTIDQHYPDRQWVKTEIMTPNTLGLLLEYFSENLAGEYTCTANYASYKLSKSVRLESIYPIKFEDAPETQNPIINTDYKVKCKVSANPPPQVDWSKNRELIKPSNRYIIEPDGLLISKVKETDDGVYTCRAIVIKTGELAIRHIKVEVHTPPTIHFNNSTIEVIEGEIASVPCMAEGKPKPTYSWIRKENNANVAKMSRFGVNELTGTMTINPVEEKDHGEYKCVASNAAANAERIIKISVSSKPKIAPNKNVTVVINEDVKLECLARGRPAPKISFKKYGSTTRMLEGRQLYDPRVFVTNEQIGEDETIGSLLIQQAKKSDDGLYECIATNTAAESYKTGHVTVEFPPSFENTPINETWTWERNPVNLTCIAESIPNATINWRLNDRDIENDIHVRKYGSGPVSTLLVTPLSNQYYGAYTCVAMNIHGGANHTIFLKEAFRPSFHIQAKMEAITATTIRFVITSSQIDGGIPIRSYVVQYKLLHESWNDALNRTWALGVPYVVENLLPQMSYSFRFAAQNDVGLGNWGREEFYTMPQRSRPGEPIILLRDDERGFVQSPYDHKFELRWKIPADNGEPIDRYEIRCCEVVRRDLRFQELSCLDEIRINKNEGTSFLLTGLASDSFYKAEIRAHNSIGSSAPGITIFRTARGIDKDHLVASANQGLFLSSAAIVGIVVASLFLTLIIIDVSCFFVNQAGLFYLVCGTKKKAPQEENKLTSLYGWRFPLPYCNHRTTTSYAGGGAKKKSSTINQSFLEEKELLRENGKPKVEVMDERLKKETRLTFDDKNSCVKTTFVGKDSAV